MFWFPYDNNSQFYHAESLAFTIDTLGYWVQHYLSLVWQGSTQSQSASQAHPWRNFLSTCLFFTQWLWQWPNTFILDMITSSFLNKNVSQVDVQVSDVTEGMSVGDSEISKDCVKLGANEGSSEGSSESSEDWVALGVRDGSLEGSTDGTELGVNNGSSEGCEDGVARTWCQRQLFRWRKPWCFSRTKAHGHNLILVDQSFGFIGHLNFKVLGSRTAPKTRQDLTRLEISHCGNHGYGIDAHGELGNLTVFSKFVATLVQQQTRYSRHSVRNGIQKHGFIAIASGSENGNCSTVGKNVGKVFRSEVLQIRGRHRSGQRHRLGQRNEYPTPSYFEGRRRQLLNNQIQRRR